MALRRARLVLAASSLLLAAALPAGAVDIGPRAGQWEVTTSTDIGLKGLPGKHKDRTKSICYDKQDMKELAYATPKPEDDCQLRDIQAKGNRATYRVTCSNGASGSAEVEGAADRFTARGSMKGSGLTAKVTHNGRRTGDCTKSPG